MNHIYLDHASTSPLSKKVLGKLDILASLWHNPNSIYDAAGCNRRYIEYTRQKLAKEINAEPEEIIFVSSGSEANSLAISGFLKDNDDFKECYCSNIEHSSILNNPLCSPIIKSDKNGVVSMEEINKKGFYSIMMCNNEIGTYQPIKEISDKVHSFGGILHVDAVQAFGKIPIDVKYLNLDMMSISGHKIGSLRGVGALYIKKGINISPIIFGTQENSLRGGSYNDLAIKSLECALDDIDYDKDVVIRNRRDFLLHSLLEIPNIVLNGGMETRNSSNINIRINNMTVDGQQIAGILDDMYNIQVSTGSACHVMEKKPSHVLKAIGLSDNDANNSIRITIGMDNSVEDLKYFCDCMKEIIEIYGK